MSWRPGCMRKIEWTNRFKRDCWHEGVLDRDANDKPILTGDLAAAVAALANDQPLEAKSRDHPLRGKWKGYRDCHVRNDLVLIYRKIDPEPHERDPDPPALQLVRLGIHSNLSL